MIKQLFKIIFLIGLVGILGTPSFEILTKADATVNYGAHIDEITGNFSGRAWSDSVGWISFERSEAGNPPENPFKNGSGPIAKFNVSTDEITGWMRVLSCVSGVNCGGWDGWIKLEDVSLTATGAWEGWGWTDLVAGWIDFSPVGATTTTPGPFNNPPCVEGAGGCGGGGGSSPAVSTGDSSTYCNNPAHHFSWTYWDADNDNQSQFQFQVDNNGSFTSPEVDRTFSGLSNPNPANNNQTVIVAKDPIADQLAYKTTYRWRVKVWDELGKDSGWVEGDPFTTETHLYPSVDFYITPESPSQEEDVYSTNNSICYNASNNVVECPAGAWVWSMPPEASYIVGNSLSKEPAVKFTAHGEEKSITLQVTDQQGNVCSEAIMVDVQQKLPGWKEILPW